MSKLGTNKWYKFFTHQIVYNCTSYQSYDKSQSRSREAFEEQDDHGKKGDHPIKIGFTSTQIGLKSSKNCF